MWNQHIEEFGWKTSDEYLIELPGGFQTRRYNSKPSECATIYGTFQEDDDRAESVVAFIFDPTKLNSLRKQLISQVLNQPEKVSRTPATIELPTAFPKIPTQRFIINKKPEFLMRFGRTIKGKELEEITLEELYKREGII